MHPPDSLNSVDKESPAERLDELAAVLAVGLLRLWNQADVPDSRVPNTPENRAENSPPGLELSRTPRLTVTP